MHICGLKLIKQVGVIHLETQVFILSLSMLREHVMTPMMEHVIANLTAAPFTCKLTLEAGFEALGMTACWTVWTVSSLCSNPSVCVQ